MELGDGRGQLQALRPLVQDLGPGAVNLEGALATGGKVFNGPAAFEQLAALGVRAVGLANNHAEDPGPGAPQATARAAREAGLLPFGGPAGPAILELGGLKVALTADDLTHGVPVHLAERLRAARARADVLVATFHVTGPPDYLPPPALRQAAEIALAAGAQVVAAHGSHVVGPLERRGQAVIAWGLGNVAFDCACTEVTDAFLLGLQFEDGRVEATVLPIDAGLRGQPARPAADPAGIFDLLEALGTPALVREGRLARLR